MMGPEPVYQQKKHETMENWGKWDSFGLSGSVRNHKPAFWVLWTAWQPRLWFAFGALASRPQFLESTRWPVSWALRSTFCHLCSPKNLFISEEKQLTSLICSSFFSSSRKKRRNWKEMSTSQFPPNFLCSSTVSRPPLNAYLLI